VLDHALRQHDTGVAYDNISARIHFQVSFQFSLKIHGIMRQQQTL
jgi:hypothetical protein